MERDLQVPDGYDYRRYDRIWQRVAPTLEPYPGTMPTAERMSPPPPSTPPAPPMMPMLPNPPTPPTMPMLPNPPTKPELNLPGAQADPCCMGSAAAEDLEVLSGFIEEELSDQRYYLAFARQAPSWTRQMLREFAAEEGAHARRLMAVYYLITGTCYTAAVNCERIWVGAWCMALRQRYHAEACGGLNYIRAAEGTTDPCLAKLLTELSEDEYRHASRILAMLERTM